VFLLRLPIFLSIGLIIAVSADPVSARPHTTPRPPDRRFGIVETYANPAAATEAGAGYTRIILRWDVIQPAGPDDWKPANVPDPFIEGELAAGREVVGLLIGTPLWACEVSRGPEACQDSRAVPDMDYWAAFARRMAQQYRGRISRWVIWNEPDVWDAAHSGSTWAGSVEDYARLLKAAYLAIKGVDPSQQVLMAGQTYFWDWSHGRRRYLDRLLEVIAADPEAPVHGYYFDAIPYHLYFNPSQTPAVLAEAQATLKKRGITGKEVWINETNAPPSDDQQEPAWSSPRFRVTQAEQAAFVLQEFSLGFAAGASRVAFYKLRNSADHPESIEPYGLLRADDSPRPALAAYQVATTYLRDFRSATVERQGSAVAVTFDRGDRTTTVLWTNSRQPLRLAVRAIASRGEVVDERGQVRPVTPSRGVYIIELPGAVCTNGAPCIIGGAPRLLVETGAPAGRRALTSPLPAALPTKAAPAPQPTQHR
jgi:hypothetical protein